MQDGAREHWQALLQRGGSTAIARWRTTTESTGTNHEFDLPAGLTNTIDKLAAGLRLPADAVLLAAHAKVVGSLSGEDEVCLGHGSHGRVLPCLLDLREASWRQLIERAADALARLADYGEYPIDALAAELDVPPVSFETVADFGADAGTAPHGVVLRVRIGRGRLTLWCRTDVVDAVYAARIAGYHIAALTTACTTPDADHRESFLLSADEIRFQDAELAGTARALPDLRVHQLFEQRVRSHPDKVAAVFEDQSLTYGELNRRANRIATVLVERGFEHEDVVAVCTERHLDWMAAVLAVFKAGCVYLPIEPHLPSTRVAAMLSRAGCRIALADRAGQRALDQFAAVVALHDLRPGPDGEPEADPGVPVAADQAAYIYFTSGSTGEPKGALCQHDGMLNHLLAKIDDLGIGDGTRVAQNAPQGFDISLWQLVVGLLTGGTTVLIPQQVVHDVARFADELAASRIEVLQLVPSYLDLLLTELARRPRQLPALRMVSATGETLKPELVRRWFDQFPEIRLVNAYGATEASDDTTHEVLDRAIDGPRVAVGRPVPGARVHVVDENLRPVPLGAPGEIVFSGVCVGRGYINDEQRTRLAFVEDPRVPGNRFYRSGDFGRWTPTGTLDFLGRKDHQVKIRGFRIEIGEIEDHLLRVQGVREAAVLVGGRGENRSLVACYCSPPALPVDSVRAALADALPDYMVPGQFFWLDTLPLTVNGKIDRKALTELTIGAHRPRRAVSAPRTPAERRLALAWATVLGTAAEHVGRDHVFFDLGGTSLSALRLVAELGGEISLADIVRHPTVADLALVLDRSAPASAGLLHRLDSGADQEYATLVCFPYSGGNTVNYLPLAKALDGQGLAVYAVQPPDSQAEVRTLAGIIAKEIAELPVKPLLLWGHSSGSAHAVETARALRERGYEVRRIYVGAQLPGDVEGRRRSLAQTARLSDAEVVAELGAQSGHDELTALNGRARRAIAAAYRRDSTAADRYFLELMENPLPQLDVPISVVLAADDDGTDGDGHTWRIVSGRVDVHELPEGGHYFLTSKPAEVAAVITATSALDRGDG
nr:amino acid adenylation domain-containing protein [Kibdelosporangium sp. MJ126-NF4]CEL13322.1 Peptide synthetase [Kibdelosporangium sp. MJ126-NF4]CTQ99013.1 Peptide synthetase [Kibdelosporangium sp. MJ126-NF4]